jgi:hypothetical protein
MKAFVFIIFCLIGASCLKAQTNIYHKWPTNARWLDHEIIYNGFQNPTTHIYTDVYVNGDTIINDTLFIKSCTINSPSSCLALFYDDTLKKRIIIRNNPALIIFEFNKQIGDTIFQPHYDGLGSTYYGIVLDVDSINLGDGFRKRLVFENPAVAGNSPYISYLIEGVGSTNGTFSPIYVHEFNTKYLQCYNGNNIAIYGNNDIRCQLDVGLQSNTKLEAISIYPNPVSSILNIEIQNISLGFKVLDLKILDCFGGEKLRLDNVFLPFKKNIDLANYENGLYLMRITTDKGLTLTKKILIQH